MYRSSSTFPVPKFRAINVRVKNFRGSSLTANKWALTELEISNYPIPNFPKVTPIIP